MEYFIQPSQPDKPEIYLAEHEINGLYPTDRATVYERPISVYKYLRENDGIIWSWRKRRNINPRDRIFIYSSGKGASRMARITCLTEDERIKYIVTLKKPLAAYLKKIHWLSDTESQLLTYENLKNNGLSTTLPGILNITNNERLMSYLREVLNFI